ncbi:hypothetical protein Pelo_9602 [Pelomyxa schiedti]|nr:hypothetical protein Pelo_9602 [Pelomyxa schiedti]
MDGDNSLLDGGDNNKSPTTSEMQTVDKQQEERQQTQMPVRPQNEAVSDILKNAKLNLDRMAFHAETCALGVTIEIDDNLAKIRASILDIVDKKIAQLKAEVQANLLNSVLTLTSFNAPEYTARQKLICPGEQLLEGWKNSLDCIYIRKGVPFSSLQLTQQGAHILDLPPDVLSHIVEYLPHECIISTRTVCTSFLDAVQTVHGCKNCTFSTEANWHGSEWEIAEVNSISTPCMDFKLLLLTNSKGLGVYLYRTSKQMYARAKRFTIEVTDGDPLACDDQKATVWREVFVCNTQELCNMTNPTTSRGRVIPMKTVPSKLHISLAINDRLIITRKPKNSTF